MNIKDPFLLYETFSEICNNPDNLENGLKSVFSKYCEISELNVLIYDKQMQKLKNALRNFELLQDSCSNEKTELLTNLFNTLRGKQFVLNDDIQTPEDIFDTGNVTVKTLSLPIKYNSEMTGLFRVNFKNKFMITENDIRFFEIFCFNLSVKIQNIVLKKRLDVNNEFYKSIKSISKIVDSQYDFQYIIPLMGEIIDKFVVNHLIYIFVKQGDKYVLFWPKACWNNKIYELISLSDEKNETVISEDKKTGVFPLTGESGIIGCIAAHSALDKLTADEIEYIEELTSQSAVSLDRANVYSEILKNASTDALTGLNNRRQFELRLKEEFAAANRHDTPLCAIMIDVDHFKQFNDMFGHTAGDKVLRTVSEVIKEQLREYDIPSRYGGEEFCILLPNTGIDEAKIVAERLRSAVENTETEIKSQKDGQIKKISVTISAGLSVLDVRDLPDDLYMKADNALYKAKENGRNRVVVYEKG